MTAAILISDSNALDCSRHRKPAQTGKSGQKEPFWRIFHRVDPVSVLDSEAMRLDDTSLDYLWTLIILHSSKNGLNNSKNLASEFYNYSLEVPSKIEELIVQFSVDGNHQLFDEIKIICAKQYYFDLCKHTILVSNLYADTNIDLKESADLLKVFRGRNLNKISDIRISDVFDAVWLVCEDVDFGLRVRPR